MPHLGQVFRSNCPSQLRTRRPVAEYWEIVLFIIQDEEPFISKLQRFHPAMPNTFMVTTLSNVLNQPFVLTHSYQSFTLQNTWTFGKSLSHPTILRPAMIKRLSQEQVERRVRETITLQRLRWDAVNVVFIGWSHLISRVLRALSERW